MDILNLVKFCQFVLKIFSGILNFGIYLRPLLFCKSAMNYVLKSQRRSCQYECIKFGEILSICSQDIEQKRKVGIN